MKAFLVTDHYPPDIGGLENSTERLARALYGAGLDVEVLTMEATCPWVDRAPFPVVRFPRHAAAYGAMRDRIRADPAPRKAACFFGFSDRFTDAHLALVATCASLVDRTTLKLPSLNEFSHYVQPGVRMQALSRVDAFVCPNSAIGRELAGGGIASDRLHVVANGVPCDHFAPVAPTRRAALRSRAGLDPRPAFIFHGRFADRKRIDLLVSAAARVREAQVLLVGYFDDRFDSGARVDLPAPGVTVIDPTRDVRPWLWAADFFASASEAEGMPNALLEAMACGLPALVSRVPGHVEVVRPEVDGQLFRPGDANGLACAMAALAAHPDRAALGRSARARVVEGFSIARVAAEYRRLLEVPDAP